MTWSRHSRRIDPINRSTYAFCHCERDAVTTSWMSIARPLWPTRGTLNLDRERTSVATFYRYASRSCCTVHAAVGWSVTPTCTTRRRSCARINEQQAIRCRWHDEEVFRDDLGDVIPEERPPGL